MHVRLARALCGLLGGAALAGCATSAAIPAPPAASPLGKPSATTENHRPTAAKAPSPLPAATARSMVAFASNRPGGAGGFDVYLFDPATSAVLTLPGANTPADERSPRLSHGGRWLLFATDANGHDSDVWLYDVETGLIDTLAPLNTGADEVGGSIDSAGSRIAYLRRRGDHWQLRLFDMRTRSVLIAAQIARYEGQVRNVNLSGDGQRMILAIAGDRGDSDLFVYDFPTATLLALPFVNSPADEISPALSADGRYALFASNRHGGLDAYMADLETGLIDSLPLANSPANDTMPRFFGGTEAILIDSNRSGVGRLYLYDRLGHTLDMLPVTHEPGFDDQR